MERHEFSSPSERDSTRPEDDCGESFHLTTNEIQRFLSDHERDGYRAETIRQYRRAQTMFYDFLPEDKRVCQRVISQWYQDMLEKGYSARTASTHLSAVNSLLDYLGQRDLQWRIKMERARAEPQELTQEEYLALLNEAIQQENETLYLLIKTFVVTGLPLQCLNDLTREAVMRGAIQLKQREGTQRVKIPVELRRELLDYAIWGEIRSGPVFRDDEGMPFTQSAVKGMISRLGEAAGLEQGKANVRNLKRLHLEYQRQLAAQEEAIYEQFSEEEAQEDDWMPEGGAGQ